MTLEEVGMNRPKNLLEYDNPPVNEVVLGVQFSTPDGYQQIYSGEVWGDFSKGNNGTARKLHNCAKWFVPIDGVNLV